jgi:hypothetical protein
MRNTLHAPRTLYSRAIEIAPGRPLYLRGNEIGHKSSCQSFLSHRQRHSLRCGPRPPNQRSDVLISWTWKRAGQTRHAMPCGGGCCYQGPIPGSRWPCSPAATITHCCASCARSAALTGGFKDVSDRVGDEWSRGKLSVGTKFKRAGVYHNRGSPGEKKR